MNRKKLVSSILTIVLCLSLIAGTTYALFTSEDNVNIAVNSGKVDVNATILDDEMVTSSLGEKQEAGKFANGGTALFTAEKVLKLTNVTPGDKVEFAIQLTNESTVEIQYRLTWVAEGELSKHLVITSDGALTTDWAAWKTTDAKVKVINVSIELPVEFTTQGLEDAAITFTVEAVQANGTELYGKTIVSDLAGLTAALADTEDKNIVAIATPIEIKDTVALDLNGKTVEGNLVLVDGANLTVEDGVLTNDDPDASAIQVNGGNLTLNDVEITSARHALRIEGDGSVVTINGGTYVAKGTAGKTQHALNVGEDGANCTVVINGGTFIGPKGTASDSGSAVTVKAGSTVTINGGNFSGGKNNTLSSKGTLVVNGGTFDQDPSAYVAEGYVVVDDKLGNWTVAASTGTVKLADGAILDLGGVEFGGTIVAEGDLTIVGDTSIKTLSATNGGTITIEDGKTLKLNNFSFGSKNSAGAEYTITGGTVTAKYGFFQHGTYALYSNLETGYMYYSFGSDITVYGTVHSQGQGDGLDYVRGKVTIAKGGKSIHDKALWVGQPESWGAMNATLIIEEGGFVQANSLSVYPGSKLINNAKNNNSDTGVKYNKITGDIEYSASDSAALKDAIAAGNDTIHLESGNYTLPTLGSTTGITIEGVPGTVIGGENTSTGFGGNFGKDTTIKNLSFEGSTNGVRWSYANGGTTVFENCTFAGDSTYGFHIDQSNGATFIFKNCTFSGFNAFAGDLVSVTFENCTFLHNGNYGHTNIWSVAYFNNCTFGENVTYSGEIYIDGVLAD